MTNLTGVSETLLLTFYARYLESQRVSGIIKDQKSIEIIKNIDFDIIDFTRTYVSMFTQKIDKIHGRSAIIR